MNYLADTAAFDRVRLRPSVLTGVTAPELRTGLATVRAHAWPATIRRTAN